MRYRLLLLFLICGALPLLAARVDTIAVSSLSMNKVLKNVVVVPDSYQDQKKRFPVVYLLHGAGDDFDKWIRTVPGIRELADRHQLIIVCPDGGVTSWYFDSPVDPSMQYETYITKELLAEIDGKYRTVAERNGRAIAGHSMGGHGALFLSMRHPDLFGAVGSMSGGLDFTGFPENWDLAKRLGSYVEHQKVWEKHTVLHQADQLKGADLRILMDCGTDDFFLDANQNMHRKLLALGVPHEYTVRPGSHDWAYWANAIKYQLLFFETFFLENMNQQI